MMFTMKISIWLYYVQKMRQTKELLNEIRVKIHDEMHVCNHSGFKSFTLPTSMKVTQINAKFKGDFMDLFPMKINMCFHLINNFIL